MRLSPRILLALVVSLFLVLPLDSCVVTRPAKLGPGFVWVPSHTARGGMLIPGHYSPNGAWVPGRWR